MVAPSVDVAIKVPGLADFRRDLKRIDQVTLTKLRDEFVVLCGELAAEAKTLVPTGGTGRAAASIRAGVSGNTAYIAGGKASVPYYGWLDFGSRVPKTGQSRRSGPWKGSGKGPKGGRFIYPTIEKNHRKIETRAQAAFDKAADEALQHSY